MRRQIEVLAPAGSMDCLKAAVLNGADAIYLGGDMYGARAYAGNFHKEELCEAIDYVHLFGKKIFLTVKTLMKDSELKNLPKFLRPYYEQGLDAVIVQDLGAMELIRECFPDLEIHASTQMTITGIYGARLAKKMGAKRVVPARELSLKEIQAIKEDTGLDIECFVHGALCYCYSGQCFMSSMLGGRSGNRGRCAGTCRLPFSLKDQKSAANPYPLSLKDLCTIDHLPEILDHGVDSLKIEGRMKGPRYVGEVTRLYRKYTDLYLSGQPFRVEKEDYKILVELFNRGGFTDGYYSQYHGKQMMSMKRSDHQGFSVGKIEEIQKGKIKFHTKESISKGDILQIRISPEEKVELTCPSSWKEGEMVVLNGQKMKKLHRGMELFRTLNAEMTERIDQGLQRKMKENLKGKIILKTEECARLIIKSGEDQVSVLGPIMEQAKKQGASEDEIRRQLLKTGETHYQFEELDVQLEEGLFVPGSVLKKLRREAFELMDEKKVLKCRRVAKENPGIVLEYADSDRETLERKPVLAVSLEDTALVDTVLDFPEAEKIYLSWMSLKKEKSPEKLLKRIKDSKRQCFLMLPQITRGIQIEEMKNQKDLLFSDLIDGLLVRNLEELSWLTEEGYQKELVADYMLYGYNQKAVSVYQKLFGGQMRMTYPAELNRKEMGQLNLKDGDLFFYGYQPLMVSAQCVKNNLLGCDKKESWLTLKDRYQKEFYVHNRCSDCVNEIYNGKPIWLGKEESFSKDLKPLTYRFHFTKETPTQVQRILHAAKAVQKGEKTSPIHDFTKGHLARGIL